MLESVGYAPVGEECFNDFGYCTISHPLWYVLLLLLCVVMSVVVNFASLFTIVSFLTCFFSGSNLYALYEINHLWYVFFSFMLLINVWHSIRVNNTSTNKPTDR